MHKKLLDFRKLSLEEQSGILTNLERGCYGRYEQVNQKVGRIIVIGTQSDPVFYCARQYAQHFGNQSSIHAGTIRRKTKIAKLLKQLESAKN